MSNRVRSVLVVALLAVVLAGCASPSNITIVVTSHSDGQHIIGSRAITLAGTLAGGTVGSFQVTRNGTAVAGGSHTDTTFSVPLTLDDGANAIVITAGGGTLSISIVYPHLAFANFAPANVVIGQPNFTAQATTVTANHVGYVYGNPLLVGGRLYISDYWNDRVLGYPGGVPTTNGASASFVLGQTDLTSDDFGTTPTLMQGPQSITVAGGKMFIAQYDGDRVLGYNSIPTTTNEAADFVVGQSGFGVDGPACTATGMNSPESVFALGSRLLVPDTNGNRVLIYDTLPGASGAAADLVLGQADFTHCTSNDDNQDAVQDAGPTARTLSHPSDVWTDGTVLVVADSANNRVLVWTSFPTSNFQPADLVLGQASMTTAASGTGASGMAYPYFLTSNGNQLFVTDSDNNRVLIFEGIPTSNGAAADAVLGQSDFTHGTENDDDQNGTVDATPSARTLFDPAGVLATDDALVVADESNRRYLVFRP